MSPIALGHAGPLDLYGSQLQGDPLRQIGLPSAAEVDAKIADFQSKLSQDRAVAEEFLSYVEKLDKAVTAASASGQELPYHTYSVLIGANALAMALGRDEERRELCLRASDIAVPRLVQAGSAGSAANRTLDAYRLRFQSGDYLTAERQLVESLEFVQPGMAQRAEIYASLATLCDYTGRDRTLEYLDLAEACMNSKPAILPQIELSRALYFIGQGLPDHAYPPLKRAAARIQELLGPDQPLHWVRSWHALVKVQYELTSHRFDSAIEAAENALAAPDLFLGEARWIGSRVEWARAMALMYRAENEGDLKGAERILIDLLESDATYPELRLGTRLRLASSKLLTGEWAAAEQLLASARSRLRGPERGLGWRASPRMLGLLAEVECRLLIGQGAAPGLVEAALVELDASLDALITIWRQTPPPPDGRGLLEFETHQQLLHTACAARLYIARDEGGAEAALTRIFEIQKASTLLQRIGAAPQDFAAFRRQFCSSKRGVLVLVPGIQESLVFAADANNVMCAPAPTAYQLSQQATEFQDWIQQDPASPGSAVREVRLADLGERLSEGLIPKKLRSMVEEWDEVAFVGSEYLQGHSLEALPWDGGLPMGIAKATSTLFSMPVAAALAHRVPVETRGLVLLASPIHSIDVTLPGLALTPAELDQLQSERESDQIYTGDRATRSVLERVGLFQSSLLSIVTHGIYDSGQDIPTGFLLADDATGIFAKDVRKVTSPPIVFLGVCGAGRGAYRGGDAGASHLGGAFLEAGARAVVYSDADLPVAATLDLLGFFQREVFAGIAPAEALRRARLKVYRAGADDPRDTCLIRVTGLAHIPVQAESLAADRGTRLRWVAWSLGGLLAGLLGVLYLRQLTRHSRTARHL